MNTSNEKRILLMQLGSFGDCLYATSVAKQIKIDSPGCHLTWAIGSIYKSVLSGNPDVDEIWELPIGCRNDLLDKWQEFKDIATQRKNGGDFDEVYFTQVFPNNINHFDGTLRTSIYRGYPKPITTSVAPLIQLLPNEIDNVANFIRKHRIEKPNKLVLFECAAHSGQSFVTPVFASDVANEIIKEMPDVRIIMSSNVKDLLLGDERIIDGSVLSFRENAELTKYCTLFVGCSSGISWLCTSGWAKPLPMIQLLEKSTSCYASMVHDHEYFGLPTTHIVEMTNCPVSTVVECIKVAISDGIGTAKTKFHQQIKPTFDMYQRNLFHEIAGGNYKNVVKSLRVTYLRYGFNPVLIGKIALLMGRCMKALFLKILR